MANPLDRPDLTPEQQFVEEFYVDTKIHRSVLRDLLRFEIAGQGVGRLVVPGTFQRFLRDRSEGSVGRSATGTRDPDVRRYVTGNPAPNDAPPGLGRYWLMIRNALAARDTMPAPAIAPAPLEGQTLTPIEQLVDRYAWYLSGGGPTDRGVSRRVPLLSHRVLLRLAEAANESGQAAERPGAFIDAVLDRVRQLSERGGQSVDESGLRNLVDEVLASPNPPNGLEAPLAGLWETLQELNRQQDIPWPPARVTEQEATGDEITTEEAVSLPPGAAPRVTQQEATGDEITPVVAAPPAPRAAPKVKVEPFPAITADEIATMTPAQIAQLRESQLPELQQEQLAIFTAAQQVEYQYKRIRETRRRDTLAMLGNLEREHDLPAGSLLAWVQAYRLVPTTHRFPANRPVWLTQEISEQLHQRLTSLDQLPLDAIQRTARGTLISLTNDEARHRVDLILRVLEREHDLVQGRLLTYVEERYRTDIFPHDLPNDAPAAITPAIWSDLRALLTRPSELPPRAAQLTTGRQLVLLTTEEERRELRNILARPDLPFDPSVVGAMIEITAESPTRIGPLDILRWSVDQWDRGATRRDQDNPEAGNILNEEADDIRSRGGCNLALLKHLDQLKTLQRLKPLTFTIPIPPYGSRENTAKPTPEEMYKKGVQAFRRATVKRFARLMGLSQDPGPIFHRDAPIDNMIKGYL